MSRAVMKCYIYKTIQVEIVYMEKYYVMYIDDDYTPYIWGKTKPHYEDIAKYLDDYGYTKLY